MSSSISMDLQETKHDYPAHGNAFCFTNPLWGETAGHRWIPTQMASNADLWCFMVIWHVRYTFRWTRLQTFSKRHNIKSDCLKCVVFSRETSNGRPTLLLTEWVSDGEWVIKFNGLSRTADIEVHVVHISRVIIAYTLEPLSSLTQMTHNLQVTLRKRIEIRTPKNWGHPLRWLVIGYGNFATALQNLSLDITVLPATDQYFWSV